MQPMYKMELCAAAEKNGIRSFSATQMEGVLLNRTRQTQEKTCSQKVKTHRRQRVECGHQRLEDKGMRGGVTGGR